MESNSLYAPFVMYLSCICHVFVICHLRMCTRGRQTGGEEINQTATFWPHFANKRFMKR